MKSTKQINGNDELFRIFDLEWNITKLSEHALKSKYSFVEVKVADLKGQNILISVDSEYAMKTALNKPLILIEFQENKYLLADGHHRLFKAKKTGVESIKAYFVPFKEHILYLTDMNMVTRFKNMYREA